MTIYLVSIEIKYTTVTPGFLQASFFGGPSATMTYYTYQHCYHIC